MKNKISVLISEIIELAINKIDPNDNFHHYVSVATYDCGGSWQVWLDFGKAGARTTHEVLINGNDYLESRTLQSTLLKVKKELKSKTSSISLRAR
jgi:hypothetical protein